MLFRSRRKVICTIFEVSWGRSARVKQGVTYHPFVDTIDFSYDSKGQRSNHRLAGMIPAEGKSLGPSTSFRPEGGRLISKTHGDLRNTLCVYKKRFSATQLLPLIHPQLVSSKLLKRELKRPISLQQNALTENCLPP